MAFQDFELDVPARYHDRQTKKATEEVNKSLPGSFFGGHTLNSVKRLPQLDFVRGFTTVTLADLLRFRINHTRSQPGRPTDTPMEIHSHFPRMNCFKQRLAAAVAPRMSGRQRSVTFRYRDGLAAWRRNPYGAA